MKHIPHTWVILFLCISTFCQSANTKTISVFSTAMNKSIPVIVITPDYTKNQKLNSVYILHGYSGNPTRTLEQDIPTLSKRADIDHTIFILPDGNFSSWYVNSPIESSSQYETFIGQELVDYIDNHFPTHNDKNKRGLLGWSMGGYGTLLIGSEYQNTFGIIGSMCGALDFRPFIKDYQVDKVLGQDGFVWEQYVIANRISFFKNTQQKIIIDCGTEDPLIDQNRQFHQSLLNNKIPHEYIERPGGHTAAYWSNAAITQLNYFIEFFNKK